MQHKSQKCRLIATALYSIKVPNANKEIKTFDLYYFFSNSLNLFQL